MRFVDPERVKRKVAEALIEACVKLDEGVKVALKSALSRAPEGTLSHEALKVMLENAELAEKKRLPLCQDTGIPVVFVRVGESVRVPRLKEAIQEGIELATREGLLRSSVCDPVTRKNTGTNTPAVIHTELAEGDALEVWLLPKGCGSENMSRLKMLSPAEGLKGVEEFAVEVVLAAGANPCPPTILGIGIGGDFETAAYLSKKALLRRLGSNHPRAEVAELEKRILSRINSLGIGPLGFGGFPTALAVHIELHHCHIASLPVAVNVQCHAHRIKKVTI